jgi:putative membrane protein
MERLTYFTLALARPDGWDYGSEGWWWIGRVLMILVWFVLLAVLFRWVFWRGPRWHPSGMDRARDILAERYARGEISSEEYHERLEHLR